MKFNKWTLGLAAVGAVSMASAVRADEAKLVPLNTAVSSTVISGYVDVAAQYNGGDPSGKDGFPAQNQGILNRGKVDAFSLNDVLISLDKPMDESPWASGYHIDLNTGSDAINAVGSSPGIRQGYIALRTPVGNGIDWKWGVFDGVTGYEGNTGYANPNYTRSYGYFINPTTELGTIASYKITDGVALQMGIGERFVPGSGFPVGLSSKNYIATLSLTAPDSWGWMKGSTLNAGTIQTFDNGGVNNYSVNATLATPVTGLKVGAAFDRIDSLAAGDSNINVFGVYGTYQATDKLGLNVRGEYFDGDQASGISGAGEEITATVEYDLWANVVSRLEFRWDHVDHGVAFNNGSGFNPATLSFPPSVGDSFLLALNLVYRF